MHKNKIKSIGISLERDKKKKLTHEVKNIDSTSIIEKTGEWIKDEYGDGGIICSICGEPCATFSNLKPRDRYCKWCGAKMGGEEDGR